MSLVSGPGRGGGVATGDAASEPTLAVTQHVEYIQKLDTVRRCKYFEMQGLIAI